MQQTSALGTSKISSLIIKLAVPAIIAQLVNLVYNIVDRIYIGNMPDDNLSMSALAVSLPVVTLIMAFTSLVGVGGAPIAGMRLGEKNDKAADKILTNSFVALTINGVVITILLLIFQEPLLYAFGASESNIAIAKEYVGIYSLGTLFVQYAIGLNPYINIQGRATLGMITVVIGAVINIILDPIFIFGMNMGVKGAALATILSQAVSAVWVLRFFFSNQSKLKIRREYLKPDIKIILTIMSLGISPFIMQSTESLLQISFNNQLNLFGSTLAVGAMASLQSFYQVIAMSLQGLAQGVQPILSYNYGAKQLDRVRKAFKILLITSICFSMTSISLVLIFPEFFASMFASNEDTLRYTAWGLRIFLFGGLTFGIQLACQQSFLALGQAKRSLSMAIFRKIIMLIPLIYILPHLIGDSSFAISMAEPISDLVKDGGRVFSVLLAESISDILAATATGLLFLSYYRKNLKG